MSKLGRVNFRKDKSQVTTFNKLSVNIPLLHPLKTSENCRFSNVFMEYGTRIMVENGVNNTGNRSKTSNNKK